MRGGPAQPRGVHRGRRAPARNRHTSLAIEPLYSLKRSGRPVRYGARMTTRTGDEGAPRGLALRRRLRRELRAYVIAALYLWVCFGALVLFKTGVLREHGVDALPFGLAAGKALLL